MQAGLPASPQRANGPAVDGQEDAGWFGQFAEPIHQPLELTIIAVLVCRRAVLTGHHFRVNRKTRLCDGFHETVHCRFGKRFTP